MIFKLTSLQLLHTLQLHLGNVVAIHIHQYILNHDDAHLLILPYLIDFPEQVILTAVQQLLSDWLKQLHCGILDSAVEELTVLVQNETIGSTVELFIAQGTGLLLVDLVDGLLDCGPVLQSLLLRPISVTHPIVLHHEFLLGRLSSSRVVISRHHTFKIF